MSTVGTMTISTPRAAWVPVIALAAGTLWTVTAELLPAALLLRISAGTGAPPGAVGVLVTAWGVTIAALSLPLARATRRVDRRTLLVASLVATGVATVLTALAPSYTALLVARTLAAVGHGLFWALVVVAAGSLVPEKDVPRAVAVVVAGPAVATVAAVPAATALGEAAGWRLAFGAVGALTVATGLALLPLLPRMAPPPMVRGRRDPSAVPVVRVAVLGGVVLVAHFAVFTYLGPVLAAAGALARGRLSVVLLVFGAAGLLGLAVAPAAARRLPTLALPVTAAVVAVALLALGAAGGSHPAVLAVVAVWGVALGALPVVFQTRLLALASAAFRPTAGAVMVVALNLGIAVGAAAGAVAGGGDGPLPLPVLGAAVAAVAAVGLTTAALRRTDAGLVAAARP